MYKGFGGFFPRFFMSLSFSLVFLISYGQPPTGQQPIPVSPNSVDPKTLTPTQLSSLLSDKNSDGKDRSAEFMTNKKIEKDSLGRDESVLKGYRPNKTYGEDAFSYAASTNLDALSTPPLDYPIGVGDYIVVALWGGADYQQDYVVARDGSIFPSGMGKINVAGLTFENVRKIVDSRFRNVVPPGTNISVTLGQPRSINVNVVGEVNRPGPVTVSAFSNAFNVVAKAGGVSQFADLRNITIRRNGVIIDNIDVYRYLNTGYYGKKQYLENGDFIIVGVVQKKVLATGQFKRPMYYQLKEDEGVKALLYFSGGLTPEALASNMKIIRTNNEQQQLIDLNANAIINIKGEDFLLQDGDIVKVDLIKQGVTNKVEVKGEVTYPDLYELRSNDRLFDVINRAGGVTKNTFLKRAYILRGAGDSTKLSSDRLEVDLSDYNEGNINSLNNVKLEANDVVLLFSTSEFADARFVEIFGEVRKPGKVNKYGGMTLQDLIFLSGGIKPTAEYGRLEISSVVDVDSAKAGLRPTKTVVKSYAINSDLSVDTAAANVVLKPFDQVFVRKNPTFELQQNITINGLVRYPGKYSRLSKNERLSSFITRAGGFKENANLAGAILFRTKNDFLREKVVIQSVLDSSGSLKADTTALLQQRLVDEPASIDLYKAMKYKNSKYDIPLQEDDVLFVPEINPFVSVQGSVQSPLKITFDKEHTNLGYYIDRAGGFGIRPWKSRVYVKYANGTSRRTFNFGFFHFYPKVREGSYVIVPVKPAGQEVGDVIKNVVISAIPIVLTTLILKYTN